MWEFLKTIPVWLIAIVVISGAILLLLILLSGREIRIGTIYIGPPDVGKRRRIDLTKRKAINYLKKHPVPPDYYSFEYIKNVVVARYGEAVGILVLRYGSQTRVGVKCNDRDYIVLVHGNYYDDNAERLDIGSSIPLDGPLANGIDIHIRLFDSFLIGLISGRPFEVSVAHDAEFESAYQIQQDYVKWIKALCWNLLTTRDAVARILQRDLATLREQYAEISQKEEFGFQNVIVAYHYICDLIKLKVLASFPDEPIPVLAMYPLSQTGYLRKKLAEEDRKLFDELVSYFKRNAIPPSRGKFETLVINLRRSLEENYG